MTTYDVVTLGETMLRLMPPNHLRFEQAVSFDLEIGGTESNTAVALSRLGLRVAWWSRLPRNSLGRRVASALAAQGVDVSHVGWAEGERVGVYFVEQAAGPREGQVIYDRRDSAISRARPTDLPEELFQPGSARLLHLTGITPALSQSAAATAQAAMEKAQAAGWLVSFDLNYRGRLWTYEQAWAGCDPFLQGADILILPVRDITNMYADLPKTGTPAELLQALAHLFPKATVVLTLGDDGALGCEPGGEPVRQAVFDTLEIDRIGAGDAFTAGLLYQRLAAPPGQAWLAEGLRWGAAMAAMKYTIYGDLPLLERAEVERLLASGGGAARINR